MVVFAVLEILPGNAAQTLMGADADPEAVAQLSAQLGLDQPALHRYGQWISGLVQGDMGESHAYGTPVLELVQERLALTVPLALLAMALATVLALAAGVYAASRHNRLGDVGVMTLAQLGIAIPNFWFAILRAASRNSLPSCSGTRVHSCAIRGISAPGKFSSSL